MMLDNPDKAYVLSREDGILYEDGATSRLLSSIPNYYLSRNDQIILGNLLRIVAKELGRAEYSIAYDIQSKSPRILTPVDIRRKFMGPLDIPREYPHPDNSDNDFKTMVLELLDAFKQGTTLGALQQVIKAYVGDAVQIEELFEKIGNGIYDQSDRNTISVSARVGQGGNMLGISEVKTLTENLYSALDLAKPAHVGITLNAIFGEDESISDFIIGTRGIQDTLRIILLMHEDAPLENPLWQSPRILPTTPDTRISPTALYHTLLNIPLSGLGVVPGGSWTQPLPDGEVVKVGYQTNPQENGYYYVRSESWERFVASTGLISPRLNRTWEVSDSDPIILDLD